MDKKIEFKKKDIISGLLLIMGLIWVGTYIQQAGFNPFWAGEAGIRMLPFLTGAMLVDVLI